MSDFHDYFRQMIYTFSENPALFERRDGSADPGFKTKGLGGFPESPFHYYFNVYGPMLDNIMDDIPQSTITITNAEEFNSGLHNVIRPIYNHISRHDYPCETNRDNHGILNHMRSLSYGLYIMIKSDQNFVDPNSGNAPIVLDTTQLFCMIVATYFDSLARIDDRTFYAKHNLHMSDSLLAIMYPLTHEKLRELKGYANSFYQFASSAMYLTIMKKVISPDYHEFVEECGFALQWYNNDADKATMLSTTLHPDIQATIKRTIFLHYFISTPHYMDHCRGVWSENICHNTPSSLFGTPSKPGYIAWSSGTLIDNVVDIYTYVIQAIIFTQFPTRIGRDPYSLFTDINDPNLHREIREQIIHSTTYGDGAHGVPDCKGRHFGRGMPRSICGKIKHGDGPGSINDNPSAKGRRNNGQFAQNFGNLWKLLISNLLPPVSSEQPSGVSDVTPPGLRTFTGPDFMFFVNAHAGHGGKRKTRKNRKYVKN